MPANLVRSPAAVPTLTGGSIVDAYGNIAWLPLPSRVFPWRPFRIIASGEFVTDIASNTARFYLYIALPPFRTSTPVCYTGFLSVPQSPIASPWSAQATCVYSHDLKSLITFDFAYAINGVNTAPVVAPQVPIITIDPTQNPIAKWTVLFLTGTSSPNTYVTANCLAINEI